MSNESKPNQWIGEPSPWVHTMVKETGKADDTNKRRLLIHARSVLSSPQENPADEAWLRCIVGRLATSDADRIAAYEKGYAIATEHGIRLPRIEAGLALCGLYKKVGRQADSDRIARELGDSAKEAVTAGMTHLADRTKVLVGRGLLVAGAYLAEAGKLATTKSPASDDKNGTGEPVK
jgi:hypothetical protein